MKLWAKIALGILGGGGFGVGGYFLWRWLKQRQDDIQANAALEVEYIFDKENFDMAVDEEIQREIVRDADDPKKKNTDVSKEKLSRAIETYVPSEEERKNFEEYMAEMESPEDDDEEDYYDDDEEEDIPAERGHNGPYRITAGEFCNTRTYYDKVSLNYFRKDDVVSDDHDRVFDNAERILGDLQAAFGGENAPDILYIRNEALEVDYEISMVDGSYRSEVLHLPEEG